MNWPKRFPVVATFTQALTQCDAQEIERVIMNVIQKAREKQQKMREEEEKAEKRREMFLLKQKALDGKTLRGTQKHLAENQPPVHIISVYDCETGIVIWHIAIKQKINEITGAKSLLDLPLFSGSIVTSDAIHTQKAWFAGVYAQQGYCFSMIKKNHRRLYKLVEEFFENTDNDQGEWQYFQQRDKGHGREELREIWVTTRLRRRLARSWKGVTYMCKIQRTVKQKGKERREIAYGITNIPKEKADAERLLELNRNHWRVENRLHYRRDMTLGEDACQIRIKGAPNVLAAVNGGILAIMDYLGVKNVASQMRHFCAKPEETLQLLLDELPQQNGGTK